MKSSFNARLSEEQVQGLIAEYTASKDMRVKDSIVRQYRNLVESVARRFTGSGEPLEDLAQEGYIGLITAVDLYDPGKGVKFSTYATHFIIGQIKHALRDRGKIIKEPAWLQELNHRMAQVIDSLNQEMNRPPTESEIAQVMHVPEEMVAELLTTREVFKVSSLDAESDDANGGGSNLDRVSDEKYTTFQLPMEDKVVLETAVNKLKLVEQKVIQDFYYTGLTQTEIAKRMGISCNYVSHILRSGTKKLRRILTTDEIMEAQVQLQLAARRPGSSEVNAEVVDNLTGLYNRGYMETRLDEELIRASRDKRGVAFAVVSILGMEKLGRDLGTMRRDDAFCAMGALIREKVRRCDIVCRMDQWSFGLIMPQTGRQAQVVCGRVEKAISSLELDLGGARPTAGFQCESEYAVYPSDGTQSADLIGKVESRLAESAKEQEREAA